MRAALLNNPDGFPQHLKVREIAQPEVGQDGVLIKVAACSICGTDVKKYFQGHKLIKSYPIIPGHEFSGVIAEVGPRAKEFQIKQEDKIETRHFREGERVVVAPVVACEVCPNCLGGRPEACEYREDIGFNYNGGFAEYMVVPYKILKKTIPAIYSVPVGISLFEAALAEPWACAIHAQQKIVRHLSWDKETKSYSLRRGIYPGDTVVIIGGGPLGCMHAELAKSFGAEKVILAQRSVHKLELARQMGIADFYVNNSKAGELEKEIRKITRGGKADIVITSCSTGQAQKEAFAMVKKGGFISFFGGVNEKLVDIPTNEIHYNGPLVGGTSGASPYHLGMALELMAQGKIDSLKYITHVLGLGYLERVFLLKGLPRRDFAGFADWKTSSESLLQEKGREFFDFLDEGKMGDNLPVKLQGYKNSIIKAMVFPRLPNEAGIIWLGALDDQPKKQKLEELYKKDGREDKYES